MLMSLRIRNIALIEQLTLCFSDGMHALTGETGAGKSIVVDAVNLALGGRADRELIRTGTDKASVEAVFDAGKNAAAMAFLAQQQIETDGTVTLWREMNRAGRGLCRVCGVVVPLSVLRELSALLMDVYGQHEGRFLMEPQYHLQFLDDAGDAKHQALREETRAACEEFLACHRAWGRLVRENEHKKARVEQLQAALEELRKAKLKPGEEEALTAEKEKNRHWEKISTAVRGAHGRIAGEEAALPLLKEALDSLQSIADIAPEYEKLAARLSSCYYEAEEIGYELGGMLQAEEYDPRRADLVESRLDLIRHLERKYGETVDAVLREQARMQDELERLGTMDTEIAELAAKDRKLLARYREAAAQLTDSRRALAETFSANMMAQLRDLGMEKTSFAVQFAPAPDKPRLPQPEGEDSLEFMISPNPGEPLKPLGKIASGGELSRIMLALKSLEADRGGVDCMVFDEIDTGISGRMAQVVAEKMRKIAAQRQVLCVTHLPQLAAMASHQLLVEKNVEDGRTNTSVRMLTDEERVDEVARMLGGLGGVDDSARAHARHMLEAAARAL